MITLIILNIKLLCLTIRQDKMILLYIFNTSEEHDTSRAARKLNKCWKIHEKTRTLLYIICNYYFENTRDTQHDILYYTIQ